MKTARSPIREEIASGGLAQVFRLRTPSGDFYAEKVLLPKFQGQIEYENLQSREFEILSRLDHPGIPKPIRLEVRPGNAGHCTQVLHLEWIEGRCLSDLKEEISCLENFSRLELAEAVLSRLTEILIYLREQKLIHGDLSPDNLMLTQDQRLYLIDFGTARLEEESGLAKRIRVAGKRYFRAPEVQESGETDFQSDVYSLGKIYEDLVGSQNLKRPEIQKRLETLLKRRELLSPSELEVLNTKFPDELRISLSHKPIQSKHSKTVLLRHANPYQQFLRYARKASFLLIWFGTSTFQEVASLQINTLPFMKISLWELSSDFMETPVTRIYVPAGKVQLEFISPSNPQLHFRRELELKAGQVLKFFEDFRNTDSL